MFDIDSSPWSLRMLPCVQSPENTDEECSVTSAYAIQHEAGEVDGEV